MPNQPIRTSKQTGGSDPQFAALEQLRLGSNPFAAQVAAVGTAEQNILTGVPDFTAHQFSELLEIIGTCRDDRPATRAYPLLGERGAGKTHLLYALRAELRQRAIQSSEETMMVVVDRLSTGMDPIDYLLWQIVNHLLTQKGDGERMLAVIAGRLTGRLFAEALRRLAPHQRADLIPPKGFWDWLGLWRGSSGSAQSRLDGIERVVGTCDGKNPTPDDLQEACRAAMLPPPVAVGVIERHLDQTESRDVLGWFRKQLYGSLAKLALL